MTHRGLRTFVGLLMTLATFGCSSPPTIDEPAAGADQRAPEPARLPAPAHDLSWLASGLKDAPGREVVALVAGMIAGHQLVPDEALRMEPGEVQWDSTAGTLRLRSLEQRPAMRVTTTTADGEPRVVVVHEATLKARDEQTLALTVQWELEAPAEVRPGLIEGPITLQAVISLPQQRATFSLEAPNLKLMDGTIHIRPGNRIRITRPAADEPDRPESEDATQPK
ncbi:hypothetical protein ACERK3_19030 [Phycisphaerales bacterium AB-hyl4]|uniref:Uncharacterized protein n=1 Tax=Natronomicrosphaera hydrolytica TaxID=3242702 RepID=A0ABV4UB25_9BACT